jgi:hypothetical protein
MYRKRTQPPRKTTQSAAKSRTTNQKGKQYNKHNTEDVSPISNSPDSQTPENSNNVTPIKKTQTMKSLQEKTSTNKPDQLHDSMDNAPLAGRVNTNSIKPPQTENNFLNECVPNQDETSSSDQEEHHIPQSTTNNEHDEIQFMGARPTTPADILFTNEDINLKTQTIINTSSQNRVVVEDLYDPVDDETSLLEPPIKDPFQFDFKNIPIINRLRPPTVKSSDTHRNQHE